MIRVRTALAKPGFNLIPLLPEILDASMRPPFKMQPGSGNRIPVATARHLGATPVTSDAPLLMLAKEDNSKAHNAER